MTGRGIKKFDQSHMEHNFCFRRREDRRRGGLGEATRARGWGKVGEGGVGMAMGGAKEGPGMGWVRVGGVWGGPGVGGGKAGGSWRVDDTAARRVLASLLFEIFRSSFLLRPP